MIVIKSTCTRGYINRIKSVYVELWDVMIMRPYCHTELVQSEQKYDLGWKLIPINRSKSLVVMASASGAGGRKLDSQCRQLGVCSDMAGRRTVG